MLSATGRAETRIGLQAEPNHARIGGEGRDLGRREARGTHIDGNAIWTGHSAGDLPREGRQREAVATLAREIPGDAACTVAAGPCQRSVGVEDGDERVRTGLARIVDRHELVEGQLRIGGDRARLRRHRHGGAAAQVEHGDAVAGAVHPGHRPPREPRPGGRLEEGACGHGAVGHHRATWVKPRRSTSGFAEANLCRIAMERSWAGAVAPL